MEFLNLQGLSPSEYYRLHGMLPSGCIEQMLVERESYGEFPDVLPYLQEARGSYPDEGFLSSITERLGELAKRLRGPNREALQGIIEAVSDIEMTTFHAAEHGISEIQNAERDVKKWLDR